MYKKFLEICGIGDVDRSGSRSGIRGVGYFLIA